MNNRIKSWGVGFILMTTAAVASAVNEHAAVTAVFAGLAGVYFGLLIGRKAND